MSYFEDISTIENAYVDLTNSTTSNLAGGGVFPGETGRGAGPCPGRVAGSVEAADVNQ